MLREKSPSVPKLLVENAKFCKFIAQYIKRRAQFHVRIRIEDAENRFQRTKSFLFKITRNSDNAVNINKHWFGFNSKVIVKSHVYNSEENS